MKISYYFYIFSEIGSYIRKYALNIIYHENILFQKKYHINSDYKLNNDDQIFHHEKNHEKPYIIIIITGRTISSEITIFLNNK